MPRHALQGKAQYHGTSMSSPNACGVAACVLSAARAAGIAACGPAALKRALVNTARPAGIADPFAQGAGLLDAAACAAYVAAHAGKPGQDLQFDVSLPARDGARGLYLRDEAELDGPSSFGVLVRPRFSHANRRTGDEMDELLALELDLRLEASADWVTCPESMRLLSAKERGGQSFAIRLNATGLSPGVHFASVRGVDAADPARGSLFSLPVTVVVPHSRVVSAEARTYTDEVTGDEFTLKENGVDYTTTYRLVQGVPNRRFITVPRGAEWATIKVKGGPYADPSASPRVYLHGVPFVRGDMHNVMSQMKRVCQVKHGVEETYQMKVKGGSTLEL